ncbi:MAG: hypothetical protein ACJAVR_002125 [Paracoccaceae bacterium]
MVFALSPRLNQVDAAATRFRNVTGDGTQIRVQEPKKIIDAATGLQIFNTARHVDKTVTLLVLEKGVHTFEDGTVIQVGELSTRKLCVKGFKDIAFAQNFATTPSIFSQAQTLDGTNSIISHQPNPDGAGFLLTMQEEEADNLNHHLEDVGWFAIEHGGRPLSEMDRRAGPSAQNVNGHPAKLSFNQAFNAAPLVVASLASYNGTDTASPRIGAIGANGFTAMALETQSHDLETLHSHEIIDWIRFSAASSINDQAPTKTAVSATMTSANEADAAVARVSNVTATRFDLWIQENDAADGIHALETVPWMAIKIGTASTSHT